MNPHLPIIILTLCSIIILNGNAQDKVNITVDANNPSHQISPYIFGKNNSLSDDERKPLSQQEWQRLKDAGINFFRESGGNNSTKYNWKKHLSSHPDWYNNVYYHNWDYAAQSLQQNIPYAQGMWSFQLIGHAAKTGDHNFNDWSYNNSQWWEGVNQNLAGGGEVNESGGHEANVEGDPELYLQEWPADSTVAILNQWFDEDKLGYNKEYLKYWSMDNEAEIWNGTHDDVMPEQLSAEAFMQKYFAVAKKARAIFPDIKLCGPVTANEWQWYNWDGGLITHDGSQYPWLEYFIKRVAEEQKASGVKLLDVLDIHFYPETNDAEEAVQLHRVYFDKTFDYPGANGVKKINGGWDDGITREYIFARCLDWLEEYMGPDHGVKLGITETGINPDNPDVVAVWYASTLGVFMQHPEVEVFAPWYWKHSMWEVIHIFSNYHASEYVPSVSDDETRVSAYTSSNTEGELIVSLVNRSNANAMDVEVTFSEFIIDSEQIEVMTLNDLPDALTFQSHTHNALQSSNVTPGQNSVTLTMPAMSVATFVVEGHEGEVITSLDNSSRVRQFMVYPNPTSGQLQVGGEGNGSFEVLLFDIKGSRLIHEMSYDKMHTMDISQLKAGVYILHIQDEGNVHTEKIVIE